MRIVARYSFNGGLETIEKHYPKLLKEASDVISQVSADCCKTKISREKTMSGKVLYSPPSLNQAFKDRFMERGWAHHKVLCEYSKDYFVRGYRPKETKGAFRDMDFVKDKLGIEVQFGKYAFMVYNVCAKMTIFHNLGIIDAGIEIVPVNRFASEMSTGVSYFEQFTWDLNQRGVSNIDIPVLILGIDV